MSDAKGRLWAFALAAALVAVAGTAPLWARRQEKRIVRPAETAYARADRWARLSRAKSKAEAEAARWEALARGLLNGVTLDNNGYYPPVDIYDILSGEPNPPGTVILEVGPGRYEFVDEYGVLTSEERRRVLTRDEMVGAYLAWDAAWRRNQLEPPWRRRIKGATPAPPKAEKASASPLERSPAKDVRIPEPAPPGTAELSDVEPGES